MAGDRREQAALSRVQRVVAERWRLDRLVKVDRWAARYQATGRDGRYGLLKMLHPELARDASAAGYLLREGRIAHLVGHANVIAEQDEGATEEGAPFVVLELLAGDTFAGIAEARPGKRLGVAEVLHGAHEALEGLSAAHARGVVHASLKPDKLFWLRDHRVKVVGFGDARFFGPGAALAADPRWGEPKSTGTAAFIAPEQALGEWQRLDGRTDLWALAASMFALLTGRAVRTEPNSNQQLLAAATKPAPRMATVAPDVPPDVAAIVDAGLAFDPCERFQDARAMQMAVRAAQRANHAVGAALPNRPATGSMPVFGAPPPPNRPVTGASLSSGRRPSRPQARRAATVRQGRGGGGVARSAHPCRASRRSGTASVRSEQRVGIIDRARCSMALAVGEGWRR